MADTKTSLKWLHSHSGCVLLDIHVLEDGEEEKVGMMQPCSKMPKLDEFWSRVYGGWLYNS